MQTTYDVQDAVGRLDVSTEKLNALDTSVKYNHAIWYGPFQKHLNFMGTLSSIGDVTGISNYEFSKYVSVSHMQQIEFEIGNFSPDSYVEQGIATRVVT